MKCLRIFQVNEELKNDFISTDVHVTLRVPVDPSSLSDGSHQQTMTRVCFQSRGSSASWRAAWNPVPFSLKWLKDLVHVCLHVCAAVTVCTCGHEPKELQTEREGRRGRRSGDSAHCPLNTTGSDMTTSRLLSCAISAISCTILVWDMLEYSKTPGSYLCFFSSASISVSQFHACHILIFRIHWFWSQ